MSSILEALRRSERERQQCNDQDALLLIAPHLADPVAPILHQPLSTRWRVVLVCAGLLAGITCSASGLLWWHTHALLAKRTEVKWTAPVEKTVAVDEVALSEQVPITPERQVLPLPRLDTESVNLAELHQASAASEAEKSALAAPWLDNDMISPEDILPTPPLPTDPVRKPAANSNRTTRVSPANTRLQLGAAVGIKSGDKLDLSGVSPELALAFRSALEADNSNNRSPLQPLPSSPKLGGNTTNATSLPSLRDLPAASRKMIPTLRFEVHNYVSDPKKRWVKFNGHVYRAGAKLADSVVLKRIDAGQVVLSVRGQEATLNALQDWM
ncbi:general secretion pathway protein GspB [Plesiomonas sp.]|uniref:general secretion pathway protein GspB n=1 Tax=Plesiomonas sp. TaxID=2486279 RepID=UPI003F2D2C14